MEEVRTMVLDDRKKIGKLRRRVRVVACMRLLVAMFVHVFNGLVDGVHKSWAWQIVLSIEHNITSKYAPLITQLS